MTRTQQTKGRGVQPDSDGGGSRERTWFIFAVATLICSAVILAAVLAGRAAGGNGAPALPTDVGTETTAATTGTDGGTPPTQAPSPPTATLGPTLACGDILVPLGKPRALPADCAPADLVALPDRMSHVVDLPILLRRDAAAAMVEMLDAAKADNQVIVIRSAYRSYGDQVRTFNYWVSVLGQQEAERVSARPGHSEHQLGTTADLTSASNGYELEGFESTSEGAWVAANAVRFGFVISYPDEKEDITGYVFEPWHVRYVGRTVAAAIRDSGLTPIEYLERR